MKYLKITLMISIFAVLITISNASAYATTVLNDITIPALGSYCTSGLRDKLDNGPQYAKKSYNRDNLSGDERIIRAYVKAMSAGGLKSSEIEMKTSLVNWGTEARQITSYRKYLHNAKSTMTTSTYYGFWMLDK